MVKWFEHLFMDEVVAKHPKRYKKRVETNKFLKKHCVVITLASNEENLFDIIDTKELLFPYYKRQTLYVVGMAKTLSDATELLQQMMETMMEEEGTFSPRLYFAKSRFQ